MICSYIFIALFHSYLLKNNSCRMVFVYDSRKLLRPNSVRDLHSTVFAGGIV